MFGVSVDAFLASAIATTGLGYLKDVLFCGERLLLRHVTAACIGCCHELRLGTAHRELKTASQTSNLVELWAAGQSGSAIGMAQ